MPITIKHKSTLLYGVALMAGATLMTGCAADPIEVPKSETYTRDFIKTFGIFDQSHDWNHATQTTVNVTTAKATDIKIYAIVDNVRYLFGTYLGVEGQQTLNVDVPKGTTELIVRANDHDYNVNAGGSVSLSGRAGESITPTMSCRLADREYWKQFTVDEIISYRTTLPEKKVNYDKVTDNFTFTLTNTEEFIIYPVYYQTSQNDEVGVYYTNRDGSIEHMPIYRAVSNVISETYEADNNSSNVGKNNILQKSETYSWVVLEDSGTDFTADDFDWEKYKLEWYEKQANLQNEPLLWTCCMPGKWNESGLSEEEIEKLNGTTYIDGKEVYKQDVYPLVIKMDWKTVYNTDEGSYDAECPYWRSKGIVVSLTKGVRYGFYIKHPGGYYFYSETNLNEKNTGSNFNESGELTDEEVQALKDKYVGKPAAHFGIYETTGSNGEKRFVVGGEDWKAGDADLNDVVFYVENLETETPWPPFDVTDKDVIDVPYTWVIACEDLGTDDFDFNDVVFGVKNYTEKKNEQGEAESATVDVTALAAGGTLPVYLYHGDEVIIPEGNTNGGEFHSWFGSYSTNQIINARTFSGPGATATIPVEVGFSMKCCQTVSGEGDSGNMGGFKVCVVYPTGKQIIQAANPNLAEKIGEAPQMICVPPTWLWPVENRIITDVYPEFTKWCADHNTEHGWHKDPMGAPGSHYVYREVATGGGGSDTPDQPGPDDNNKILTGEFLGYTNEYVKSVVAMQYTIASDVLESAKEIVVSIKVDDGVSPSILRADKQSSHNIDWNKTFNGSSLENLKEDGGVFIISLYRSTEFAEGETPTIEVSITATM